jgi:DNA-binding XRE family transcriptional regulator
LNYSDKLQKYLSDFNVKEEIAGQILDKMLADDTISESKENSLILQKWRIIKQPIKRSDNLTDHMLVLSTRLYAWRKERALTQYEAAARLRVGMVTYQRWEEGSGYPSLRGLERISEALNISLDELTK